VASKGLGASRLFNQKFQNFGNGSKWYGNFLGKFSEIPRIVIFPKCEPFNQKFRDKLKWNENSRVKIFDN